MIRKENWQNKFEILWEEKNGFVLYSDKYDVNKMFFSNNKLIRLIRGISIIS